MNQGGRQGAGQRRVARHAHWREGKDLLGVAFGSCLQRRQGAAAPQRHHVSLAAETKGGATNEARIAGYELQA